MANTIETGEQSSVSIDLNARVWELPLVSPLLPRWWRCWTIVDARCPDFDSMARLSIATFIYNRDGAISDGELQKAFGGRFPTTIKCGLAFIQRSM